MTLRIILEHLFITVAMASFLSIVVLLVVTVFLVARRLPVVVKAPAPPKRKVLLVRTKPSSLWEQQDQPLKEPVAAPEKARYCSSPLFAPPPLKTLSLRSCRKLNIASLSIPSPFLLSLSATTMLTHSSSQASIRGFRPKESPFPVSRVNSRHRFWDLSRVRNVLSRYKTSTSTRTAMHLTPIDTSRTDCHCSPRRGKEA